MCSDRILRLWDLVSSFQSLSFDLSVQQFNSCLSNRNLDFSSSSGSILGPVLFSPEMLRLDLLLILMGPDSENKLSFHAYADDLQVYMPVFLMLKLLSTGKRTKNKRETTNIWKTKWCERLPAVSFNQSEALSVLQSGEGDARFYQLTLHCYYSVFTPSSATWSNFSCSSFNSFIQHDITSSGLIVVGYLPFIPESAVIVLFLNVKHFYLLCVVAKCYMNKV